MYCKKCGEVIDNDAVVCPKCGCSTNVVQNNHKYNVSKTGMGILMGICLGLIGLVIGIVNYPEETIARKTFIKAWLITFLISLVISSVFIFIILNNLNNMIDKYY